MSRLAALGNGRRGLCERNDQYRDGVEEKEKAFTERGSGTMISPRSSSGVLYRILVELPGLLNTISCTM